VVGQHSRQQSGEEIFGVFGVNLSHDAAQFLHELHADLSASALLADQTQPHWAVDTPSLVEGEEVIQE
jgi:hypothetical protein